MSQFQMEIVRRIQAIAQSGLAFTKDPFDKERYQELMTIAATMMSSSLDERTEDILTIFNDEQGYPTPKLDVRGVVFHNKKILLVKEKMDNLWALPGGFCEVGLSPNENVVKEVIEEAGIDVKAKRLLAMLDMNKHHHPKQLFHYYKIFIECEWLEGSLEKGLETSEVNFFEKDHLPPLSTGRNTEEQIKLLFSFMNEDKMPIID